MKICPICGASLIAIAHVDMQQDWEGNWRVCGVESQDYINNIAENPDNVVRCPNEVCGNAYIFWDSAKLSQRAVIPYDPRIGTVSDTQLKEYYYSVVDPRGPAHIPSVDKAYENWKNGYVSFVPWCGTIVEAIDV